MPSGKQLSFAFGEISPSLKYKVDTPFYSQGLKTLFNAMVKKTGGVQNRPGMKYLFTEVSPVTTPVKGEVNQRIFGFTSSDGKRWIVIFDKIINGTVGPTTPQDLQYSLKSYREYTGVSASSSTVLGSYYTAITASAYLVMEKAEMVTLGDSAVITVPDVNGKVWNLVFKTGGGGALGLDAVKLISPTKVGTPTSGTINQNNYGSAPMDIPVCYMVTQEQTDGAEVKWLTVCFAQGHPHSDLTCKLSGAGLDCPAGDGIKQYNVYRSAGTGANAQGVEASHYALVGRITPGTPTIFTDYLVAPDITVQPPTDPYLYAPDGYIRKLTYYKGRTVVAYKKYQPSAGVTATYVEGQLGASKIGSPKMFGRPLTPNLVDAFSFTIPQDRLGEITQLLPLNRLMVFTRKNVFVIRGGDNGVLTSKDVNPETIYFEGAPDDVTPVAMGSSGFFVNSDKSKILLIQYPSDQSGIKVQDVSSLSDHLFEKRDVRRIEVVSGKENILWILRKDGSLISFTFSEENGILGWARHQTDGYIEDICMQEVKENVYDGDDEGEWVQTLFLIVVRDGQRRYERMAIRNDLDSKRFMFADYAKPFGRVKNISEMITLNITTATTYAGGEELTLTDTSSAGLFISPWVGAGAKSDLQDGPIVGKKIDFFYDIYSDTEVDNYGNPLYIGEGKVRLTITQVVNANVLKAVAMEDIPAQIQNVNGQVALTTNEKIALQQRWLEAINQITGLTRLANKQVSVFADGQVLSSPNNPNQTTITVSNTGVLDLGDYYNWGYYGLPYTTNIETLDIEAGDNRTLTDKGKLINQIGLGLRRTSGGFVGQTGVDDLLDMEQISTRQDLSIENPSEPYDGYLTVDFPSNWDMTGRVLIKQVDPLPMSILSVYPKGVIGE